MNTGEVFSTRQGEAVFIPSYTRVRYFHRMSNRFIAMHFNLTFLSGIDLFRESQQIRILRDSLLFREISDIFHSDRENLIGALRLESLILKVCARFLPENIDEKKWKTEERYHEIFTYIREHLSADLEVAQIAAFAKMAPDAFSHRFSNDLGISPKQYVQQMLIRELSKELVRKDISIKELADCFRFCSEFYFSTFFKRQTGFSPSEYRKRFCGPE